MKICFHEVLTTVSDKKASNAPCFCLKSATPKCPPNPSRYTLHGSSVFSFHVKWFSRNLYEQHASGARAVLKISPQDSSKHTLHYAPVSFSEFLVATRVCILTLCKTNFHSEDCTNRYLTYLRQRLTYSATVSATSKWFSVNIYFQYKTLKYSRRQNVEF